jgi:hypothetical protein
MGKIIAGALAIAIFISIAPHKSTDDVTFLERLASTVERAKVLAPETREFISQITSGYETRLSDAQMDLRRQKALARIEAVVQPAPANGLSAGMNPNQF